MPNIALCITVKNEEALIRANLQYHHYIGVDTVYLYLDAPTDNTQEQIYDLPYVVIENSVNPETVQRGPDWDRIGKSVIRQHSEHHCARQILNMSDAYCKAGKAGHDWLVCIDADELVCPIDKMQEPDALKICLSTQTDETDAISFQTLELLQYRESYNNVVFAEEKLFKRMQDEKGEIMQMAKRLQRSIPDPVSKGESLLSNFYYGHNEGKVAVRTQRGLVPHSVHRFKHPDRQTIVQNVPYLLHYVLYSLDDYLKKHRNFSKLPDRWVSGSPTPSHLQSWIKFVNSPGVTEEDVAEYYRKYIQYPQSLIEEYRRLTPSPIIEIDEVRQVFNQL